MSNDIYTAPPRSENLLKLSQGLALSYFSKIVARSKSSFGRASHDLRHCHAIPESLLLHVSCCAYLGLCRTKNVASPFLNAPTIGLEPSLVNNNLVI